ncbi:MAG: AAA family ATPase, partial [Wenzhouxiangella sp.]
MSKSAPGYQRALAGELKKRLAEPRRWIQIVTGARQVGKTTLVQQVTEALDLPVRYASADEPALRDREWLVSQWEAARFELAAAGGILVLDEIQKVEQWSETVKRLWDEDSREARPLKVVLLGSAPLLLQQGLT